MVGLYNTGFELTEMVYERLKKEEPVTPPCLPAASVSFSGLRKSFDEKEVLRGIDITLAAGEFVAIVGRSGCGKSTLLRLLAGLDRATDGRISFLDQGDVKVRVMYQEPRLLPWASVLDNVKVGLGDRPSEQADNLAREALKAVGLVDRAGEWPAVLSGGQKQRVALARALVSAPQVLALDEPLGALDALTRIEMQALVEQVWQSKGFTALMVTHDVGEAIALADRVILIEDGRVALDRRIDLPRPRQRGSEGFAALEREILTLLLEGQIEPNRTIK